MKIVNKKKFNCMQVISFAKFLYTFCYFIKKIKGALVKGMVLIMQNTVNGKFGRKLAF